MEVDHSTLASDSKESVQANSQCRNQMKPSTDAANEPSPSVSPLSHSPSVIPPFATIDSLILTYLATNPQRTEISAPVIASALRHSLPLKESKKQEQELERTLQRMVSQGLIRATRIATTKGGFTIWSRNS